MTDAVSPSDRPAAAPRKARWGRRILIALGALVLLLLLLVLLLPTLLSTGAGKGWIQASVNNNLAGKVEMESLSLGWGRGQMVTGLKVYDPQGQVVLTADRVELPDASILALARGSRDLGLIRVVKPDAAIVQDQNGQTNIAKAFAARNAPPAREQIKPKAKPGAEQPATVPENLSVKLEVVDGHATYVAPGIEPAEVTNLALTADAVDLKNILLKLQSQIRQGGSGGSVNADVKIANAVGAGGVIQPQQATIDSNVTLASLPVAVADRLLKQNGALVALLGPVLDGKLTAKGNLSHLEAQLHAQSQHMAANGAAKVNGGTLTIAPGTQFKLTIVPEAWAALTKGQASAGTLLEPFDVVVQVDQFSAAVKETDGGRKADWSTAAIQGRMTVGDIFIDAPQVGRVALRGTEAAVASENLAKALTANFATRAEKSGQQPGQVKLTATLQNAFNQQGAFDLTGATSHVEGIIAELPLAVIDQVARLDGMLTDALGPVLNATVKADSAPVNGGGVSGAFALTARSANLVADIKGPITAEKIQLAQGSQAALTIQQALLAHFVAGHPGEPALRLARPAPVQVTFADLTIPMREGKTDLAATTLDAAVRIPELALVDPKLGPVTLRDADLTLSAKPLASGLGGTIKALAEQGSNSGRVDLTLAIKDLVSKEGKVAFAGSTTTIDGRLIGLPVALADTLAQQNGRLVTTLGPKLDSSIHALYRHADSPAARYAEFKLEPVSNNLQATLAGRLDKNVFNVEPGSALTLRLPAGALAAWMGPAKGEPPSFDLAEPAVVRIEVTSLAYPLGSAQQPADLGQAQIGLHGTVDQIVLSGVPAGTRPQLRNVEFTIPKAKLADTFSATLTAAVLDGQQQGSIKATATIANALKPDQLAVDANVDISSLPVSLLDAFGGQQGKLLALLGGSLDQVGLSVTTGKDQVMRFHSDIKSERLRANVGGQYVPNKKLTVDKNSQAELDVTPQAWTAWQTPSSSSSDATRVSRTREPASADGPTLTLAAPLHLKLAINQLLLAWAQPRAVVPIAPGSPGTPETNRGGNQGFVQTGPTIDLAGSTVDLRLATTGDASFRQGSDSRVLTLRDLGLAVQSDNINRLVTIRGQSSVLGGGDTPGKLTTSTDIRGLAMKPQGGLDLDALAVQTDTQAQKFPIAILDALGKQNGQLVEALGEMISTMSFKVAYLPNQPSSLDLKFQSDNASANVLGTLTRQAGVSQTEKTLVLTLNQDATATFRVTPKLSKVYLAKLNPILADAQSGKEPVKLTLRKEGFSVPVSPFDIDHGNADAELAIGTLIMRRSSGMLGGVLDGLLKIGTNIRMRDEFPANFTTLKAQLRNGTIATNDLWFTTDLHDLSLGSKARVFKQGETWFADVVLGLGGETLASVRGLGKSINPDSVMEIPVQGPLDRLSVDPVKLVTRLAPMLASSIKGGGELGGAIGQGLSILEGAASKGKGSAGPQFVTTGWPNKPKAQLPAPEQVIGQPVQPQQQPQATPDNKPPPDSLEGLLEGLQKSKDRKRR